jgi:hypothetical protein
MVWKFETESNHWAYMKESENTFGAYSDPKAIGARKGSKCVLQQDILYVQGGYGYDSSGSKVATRI